MARAERLYPRLDSLPNSPPPPAPLIIGVSGHRDLHASSVDGAKREVEALLDRLRTLLPNTPIKVMVGMAAGADLLVATAAVERGLAVDAVLPMPLEDYIADFEPESETQLRSLLAHANVEMTVLGSSRRGRRATPAAIADRDALYLNVTRALIRRSTLLIALWDGELSLLPAGTADTVTRFLTSHTAPTPVTSVSFVEGEDVPAGRQTVYWISVAREGGVPPPATRPPPCYVTGIGEGLLRRHATMPEELRAQLADLDRYNREYAALDAAHKTSRPDTLPQELEAEVAAPERALLARIDAEYGKADTLAVYCQTRSLRLFKMFGYMASGMGLLFLTYSELVENEIFMLGYLVLLLLGLSLFHSFRSRHWFSKHLAYRALAETMRTQFFLRLTGADRETDAAEVLKLAGIEQFTGFAWITTVLRSVQPFNDLETPHGDHERGRLSVVLREWLDAQQSYFKRKVGQLEHSHKRLEGTKRMLLYLLALVTVSLLVFAHTLEHLEVVGISAKHFLLFLMGLLPVWLGIWELYQDKLATRELLWQYRNQLGHFSRAKLELSHAQDPDRRLSVLADLGKDSLMECYLWTIHRFHREHEPPSGG